MHACEQSDAFFAVWRAQIARFQAPYLTKRSIREYLRLGKFARLNSTNQNDPNASTHVCSFASLSKGDLEIAQFVLATWWIARMHLVRCVLYTHPCNVVTKKAADDHAMHCEKCCHQIFTNARLFGDAVVFVNVCKLFQNTRMISDVFFVTTLQGWVYKTRQHERDACEQSDAFNIARMDLQNTTRLMFSL